MKVAVSFTCNTILKSLEKCLITLILTTYPNCFRPERGKNIIRDKKDCIEN